MEKKFFEMCEPVVRECGLGVYDLDYIPGSSTLRLFIQNPQTQSAVIEDCMKVDKALGPHFEANEWIPENIVLEVSSPGLFRQLNTIDHFKSVEGQLVAITLVTKLDESDWPALPRQLKGQKKLTASLKNVGDEGVELVWENGYEFKFTYEQIKKANLETDLSGEIPRN